MDAQPVVPGDRLTVEIQHANRSALRQLIGLLRSVEVLDTAQSAVLNEDGTQYTVNARRLSLVALVEVSIFTDPATGGWWAPTYDCCSRHAGNVPMA